MPYYKVEDPENYPNKRALILEAANTTIAKKKACKEWGLKISDQYHGESSLKAKKISFVSLAGRTVCFCFNETNCFKERSGECSLQVTELFLQQFKDDVCRPKADAYYCQKLSKFVEKIDPLKFPIFLYKHKCGHYQSGSGLHRTCIAGHLKIHVPINLGETAHKNCTACDCINQKERDVLIEF
jgi:hypothetical protein